MSHVLPLFTIMLSLLSLYFYYVIIVSSDYIFVFFFSKDILYICIGHCGGVSVFYLVALVVLVLSRVGHVLRISSWQLRSPHISVLAPFLSYSLFLLGSVSLLDCRAGLLTPKKCLALGLCSSSSHESMNYLRFCMPHIMRLTISKSNVWFCRWLLYLCRFSGVLIRAKEYC